MSVTDISKAREARNPQRTGIARCIGCKHEWVATAPVGAPYVDCPECEAKMGRFIAPALLQPDEARVQCSLCGSQLFMVTAQLVLHCVSCGNDVELRQ